MEETSVKPTASVIVPTYNSEGTLEECLKSVRNQTYAPLELIVVDGFSSDCTLRIAKQFGARIIQKKGNPALARNAGVESSTGKYVLFLDSDQVLSSFVIEQCIDKCETEGAEMVKIPEIFIGRGFWSRCSAFWKNCYEKVEQSREHDENAIRGEPRFFDKGLLMRAGMLDITLLWGENYDAYEKLRKKGVREITCRSRLYHYEPTSLRKILIKDLRYGKSVPTFVRQTNRQVFPTLIKQSFSALKEMAKNSKGSPAIIVGCEFLLSLKAYSTLLGFISAEYPS
jgi:glycosyltransferase involved in cell wall biosynthesis